MTDPMLQQAIQLIAFVVDLASALEMLVTEAVFDIE